MRTWTDIHGHTIMVSNQEFKLLKKVELDGNVNESLLGEYYRELGDKLYSKSLLNKGIKNGEVYYLNIKRK